MIRRTVLLSLGLLLSVHALSAQTNAPATYTLKPTPKTIAYGCYDAKTPPPSTSNPATPSMDDDVERARRCPARTREKHLSRRRAARRIRTWS